MRSAEHLRVAVLILAGSVATAQAQTYSLFSTYNQTFFRNPWKKNPGIVSNHLNNVWYYDSDDADGTDTEVTTQFRLAMSDWEGLGGHQFNFYDSSVSVVDAPHDYDDAYHDLYWEWEPLASWLGFADMFPPYTANYAGNGFDIVVNSARDWSFDTSPAADEYHFRSMATHELGHVLGIAHASGAAAIMFPSMPSGAIRVLSSLDRSAIRQLYGASLSAGASNIPSSMVVGESYSLRFYFSISGQAVQPATTDFYLDLSIDGPVTVSPPSWGQCAWQEVGLYAPGSTIYSYSGSTQSAVLPLISGRARNPAPGVQYYIDVDVTPFAADPVYLFYRASYIDPSQGFANGYNCQGTSCSTQDWDYDFYPFGEIVPRLPGGSASDLVDQQGFPVFEVLIPISAPTCTYTVIYPNGGETLTKDSAYNVTWDRSGGACGSNVKLELYKAGVFQSTIVGSTSSAAETYSWTVSAAVPDGNDYRVRVTDLTTAAYWDQSNANFTIQSAPTCTYTVTYPNGGETLTKGSAYNVTWDRSGGACGSNVKLELYKAGVFQSTIVGSTSSAAETYSWTVSVSCLADQVDPVG